MTVARAEERVLAGVLDGHGGRECAHFCAERLEELTPAAFVALGVYRAVM